MRTVEQIVTDLTKAQENTRLARQVEDRFLKELNEVRNYIDDLLVHTSYPGWVVARD